jgi:hypothetical protein
MQHQGLLRFAPLALCIAGCANAQQTFEVSIPATSNIYASGQSTAFSGTLPPVVTFAAGSVQAIRLEAIGKVSLGAGEPYSGPKGIPFAGGTGLTAFNGLSGIDASNAGFFLTAVFLDDSVPGGTAPPTLNFSDAEDFLVLNPALFQTFYVGNGFTGTTPKTFYVPQGATRLFLGISDGCFLASGPPGCYNDNLGKFEAEVVLIPFAN